MIDYEEYRKSLDSRELAESAVASGQDNVDNTINSEQSWFEKTIRKIR